MAKRLHNILVDRYVQHYTNVNRGIEPSRGTSPKSSRNMYLMYGDLIKSLPEGTKILDLGCGTGIMVQWLLTQPHITPVGVDSSPSQVDFVRKHLPDTEITCSDGLAYLQKHPNTFGGIFCMDVLEHIPDEDTLLEWVEAAYASLQEGGFFVSRVPNGANLTSSYSRYMDMTHKRIFTRTSLFQLLDAGGFQNCRAMPIQSHNFSGKVRLVIEALLHRIVFRICGRELEYVFTSNVIVVGFKG